MRLKEAIKNKIYNILGLDKIQSEMRNLLAYRIFKDLSLAPKESPLLAFYPKNNGIIEVSSNESYIKKYLSLVNPIISDVRKLKRVGGSNDGGYVMATPPHFAI